MHKERIGRLSHHYLSPPLLCHSTRSLRIYLHHSTFQTLIHLCCCYSLATSTSPTRHRNSQQPSANYCVPGTPPTAATRRMHISTNCSVSVTLQTLPPPSPFSARSPTSRIFFAAPRTHTQQRRIPFSYTPGGFL